MPAFIISTVTISNPEKFAEYGKAIAGLSEKYGGEYIVRGVVQEALEGAYIEGERAVVVKFPDADSARAYIQDPTYKAARSLRENAADVRMLLLDA